MKETNPYEPVKLPHGANNIGRIDGVSDDMKGMLEDESKMGPTMGYPDSAKMTPMTEGIGELPVSRKDSDVPGSMIDGLHDIGAVDGKKGLGKPESGGSPTMHRENASGMTYEYPGL